jgi:Leucine-rich repeat (LRR) protein
MNSLIEIKQQLLKFIQEWERLNDPSVMLNFYSFECLHDLHRKIVFNELDGCTLIDAPYIPNNVVHIYSSTFIKLPNTLPQSLKILSIKINLYQIPELPDSLERLHVSGDGIREITIPRLPNSLRILSIQFGTLDELFELPPILETLICNHSNLRKLPALPKTLKVLNIENNNLRELPELPDTLEKLLVGNNSLENLSHFPNSIITVDVSDNYLKQIPALPPKLEALACRNNKIEELPAFIPSTLRYFMFYNNKFSSNPVSLLPDTVLEYIGGEYGNKIIPDVL